MSARQKKCKLETITYYESFGGGLGIPIEIEFRQPVEGRRRRGRQFVARFLKISASDAHDRSAPSELVELREGSSTDIYNPRLKALLLTVKTIPVWFTSMLGVKPAIPGRFKSSGAEAEQRRIDIWLHP